MRAFIKNGKLHLVTREFFKGIWVTIPETEIVFTKRQTNAIREAVTDELIKDMEIHWK